ncbi:MAG: adenosine deaminase [Chloroflexi bacterium]|nr:adenosine deaminase [Chloroflexota bacterium]
MTLPPGARERPSMDRSRFADWPKTELHLHLDGSLLVATALDLARTRAIDAPTDLAGMRAVLVAPERCGSQAELLRAFELPIALLQDAEALERVTRELVVAKALDGVRYVEIRWGPLLHERRGLALAAGIAAVCDGATAGAGVATAAGHPIVVRLIATALRSHDPAANVRLAETAAAFRDRGLVGWDLAGPEASFPDPTIHRRAFEAARSGGLRITCHAGEWGGAAQVRRALALDPERIAHGPAAIDDPDLCAELIARAVSLDLCPTSNVQAGIVPSLEAHPLAHLQRAGVPVTLSTDDLTVSDVSLAAEYARAVDRIGLAPSELWAIDRRGLDVAFAEPAAIAPLTVEFDAWAAERPELLGRSAAPGQ